MAAHRNRFRPDGPRTPYRAVYRDIAEHKLGRKLLSSEDVHHKDLNHSNHDPKNLEVLPHGKHTSVHFSGEGHWACKLSDEEVRQILLRRGENQYALAKEFGVTQPTISTIMTGKRVPKENGNGEK